MDHGQLAEIRALRRPNWHEYFMAMAKLAAIRSTCTSRPVGCVIAYENRILATGYNGPPSGYPHCIDKNKQNYLYCARRENNIANAEKLQYCQAVHAEENAIRLIQEYELTELAAGATAYVTLSPCIRCIEALGEFGIEHVYYEHQYESCNKEEDEKWRKLAKSTFKTYKEFKLPFEIKMKIFGTISEITSMRALASK